MGFDVKDEGRQRYLLVFTKKGKVEHLIWREYYDDAVRLANTYKDLYEVAIRDLLSDTELPYREICEGENTVLHNRTTRRYYRLYSTAAMSSGESRYYIKKSERTRKPTPKGNVWERVPVQFVKKDK